MDILEKITKTFVRKKIKAEYDEVYNMAFIAAQQVLKDGKELDSEESLRYIKREIDRGLGAKTGDYGYESGFGANKKDISELNPRYAKVIQNGYCGKCQKRKIDNPKYRTCERCRAQHREYYKKRYQNTTNNKRILIADKLIIYLSKKKKSLVRDMIKDLKLNKSAIHFALKSNTIFTSSKMECGCVYWSLNLEPFSTTCTMPNSA